MSILMPASSQTQHSILCVAGARLSFAMPEEFNRILTDRIYDPLFATERSGGKISEIRDRQVSARITAKIRG
jgi:hypothetical protein